MCLFGCLGMLLSEEFFLEIDKINLLPCSGEGGVEPSQVAWLQAVFKVERRVDEDGVPLSALGLVACEGVGELDLQGVVPKVFLHLLVAVATVGYVHIVLFYGRGEALPFVPA